MRQLATGFAAPLIFWAACGAVLGQEGENEPGVEKDQEPPLDAVAELHEAIKGKVAQTRLAAYQKTALSVATVERTTEQGTEIGCGFFVDDEGTFVTVLSTAGETLQMKVKYGGREFVPQLLTIDPYTRLALLKLEGVKPPGLELVSSRTLEIGDFVIAVAETPREGNRCTIGRLAGREKNFDGVQLAATLLRLNMDAKPGSFGAPLVSVSGKVGGVVLLSVTGDKGVCYALPSELIEKVRRDYAKHGKIQSCWMGIGLAQGTTTPAIVSLSDDSPAKAAGLKPGDVIRKIGNRSIREYQDVVDACYYLTAEESVSIKVMRGLEDVTVDVVPSLPVQRKGAKPAAKVISQRKAKISPP